ncbi:MAG TPA: cyclase [Anaerolineae bacterium]|nr:cyclase [Anaerolineae bacterium]HIP73087.1 cyclase [Anaerolineae bacterium]
MSNYVIAHHQVEDFAKWKAVFDSVADLRRANGETSAQILHAADDPNSLTLIFGWDSIENARSYTQSPELKAAMQKAGVTGPPTFYFVTD